MTIIHYSPTLISGLSTDTKPTTVITNCQFIETNTGSIFRYTGSSWVSLVKPYSSQNKLLIYIDASDSSKCKVLDIPSGTITRISSDSTAANVTSTINTALSTDLTGGRTHKESVAFEGIFSVTKITIPSYTILNLEGAKFTQANSTNDHMFVNSDTSGGNTHIDIIGGYVDGNKAGQTEDSGYGTRCAVCFKKVTYFRVSGMYNINSNSSGIFAEDCQHGKIDHNTIKDTAKLGIDLEDSGSRIDSDILVDQNTILNTDECWFGTEANDNVTFKNNYCNGIVNASTSINFNGFRTIIDGNILIGSTNQMIIGGSEATAAWHPDHSKVINNILIDCAKEGISFGSVQPCTDILIDNNWIQSKASPTSASSYGVRAVTCTRVKISNNHINGFDRNGILADGYAGFEDKNITIQNNTIWDNGQDTSLGNSKFRAGIYIYGDSANANLNTLVTGNRCYDTAGASGTQTWGLAYEGTTNLVVSDNDFRGNKVADSIDVDSKHINLVIHDNPYREELSFRRTGKLTPVSSAATTPAAITNLVGALGAHTPTGDGTNTSTYDTTEGLVSNYVSTATGNVNIGLVSPASSVPICRTLFAGRIITRIKIDSTTSARFYVGLVGVNALPISDTPMASAVPGVMVGWSSSDTNWTIYHNDASGSVVKDNITGPIAKNAVYHTIEIYWNASATSIYVSFDGVLQTITSDIPATTDNLWFNAVGQTTTTTARTCSIHGIWVDFEK